MSNLLPCPWCGEQLSSLVVSEGLTHNWRKVNGCCADGPEILHDTMAKDKVAAEIESTRKAIEAWNTRAPVVIDDAMVERAYVAFFKPESHKDVDGTYGPKPAMRSALVAALGVIHE